MGGGKKKREKKEERRRVRGKSDVEEGESDGYVGKESDGEGRTGSRATESDGDGGDIQVEGG